MTELSTSCPTAFIFDCDGTLVDSMGAWLASEPRLLATYGVSAVPDDFAEFECLALEDECRAIHQRWGVGESAEAVYERLHSMMLEAYRREVKPLPGVVAFLEAARAAHVPMAIATSTPKDLVAACLEANDMSRYFCYIATTGETGTTKKRPDVYDLALRHINEAHAEASYKREDSWVFEDAVFGLATAGAAGYRRVGIFDPSGRMTANDVRDNCEVFIASYDELGLEQLFGSAGQ